MLIKMSWECGEQLGVSSRTQKARKSRRVWLWMMVENNANQERVRQYKKKIEGELEKYCNEVLHLLDHKLLPKASNEEARVFYMKM